MGTVYTSSYFVFRHWPLGFYYTGLPCAGRSRGPLVRVEFDALCYYFPMTSDYDFPVELQRITTQSSNIAIPNRLAVVRTDTLETIGVVSKKYSLLPHAEVIDTLRETLKGQTVEEKILLTHHGARMHLEITLPDITLKIDGDEIAMRLVVSNSYDGSRKVNIAFGAYRLVCSNGMIVGRKLLSLAQRHVGEISLEVKQTRKQMTMLTELFKATAPTMQKMANKPLSKPKKFFDPKTLHIPAYLTTIARGEFKKVEDGTVWDAYNALTYAITHKMKKNNPELATTLGKNAWTAATASL